MNKPEQQFWVLLKSHLPGDVSRIENTADVGTPDVTGAYNGKDYWVELKYCDNKNKIKDVDKLLRSEQYVWHKRRIKHGSLIFTITRYPNKIVVESLSLSHKHIFEREKNKWPWNEIESTIVSIICNHGGF